MPIQALRGFRDYLPAEMLAKSRMLATVRAVFESFGYPPLETPALEYSEVLLGKYGAEGELLMYRFLDNGGRDVCLRYDLTVPLARVVAEHGSLRFPFRRYQIAPVWRAEKPGKGRYREFVQCDVDLVGIDDPAADAEILLLGCAVLEALRIGDFRLQLNHRGLLRGLTTMLGIAPGEREAAFLRWLDKLPKIGSERFAAGLAEELGLTAAAIDQVLAFATPDATPAATIERARRTVGQVPEAAAGLERIERVLALVEAGGQGARIAVDCSIARGLSYYTGLIYETTLTARPDYGSIMSGGRYDQLIGTFAGRELPAVGISLGVDRLFNALLELRQEPLPESPARVLVVQFSADSAPHAFRLARALRDQGISALVYPEPAKLKKQFQFADALGIPFTAVVGESEAARGTVALKHMASGVQQDLPMAEVIARLGAVGPGGGPGALGPGGEPGGDGSRGEPGGELGVEPRVERGVELGGEPGAGPVGEPGAGPGAR